MGLGVWNVLVMRNLNDWKIAKYKDLFQLISSVQVNLDSYKLLQKPKKDGQFSVNSYYDILMGTNDLGIMDFPFKQIWKAQTPPKMVFFACEVGKERILTIDNPMKNDRTMANVCYLRKQVTKTYNYLLL